MSAQVSLERFLVDERVALDEPGTVGSQWSFLVQEATASTDVHKPNDNNNGIVVGFVHMFPSCSMIMHLGCIRIPLRRRIVEPKLRLFLKHTSCDSKRPSIKCN